VHFGCPHARKKKGRRRGKKRGRKKGVRGPYLIDARRLPTLMKKGNSLPAVLASLQAGAKGKGKRKEGTLLDFQELTQ